MIPLLHDFSNATVLIFGGGSVGARKSRRFAREGAVVVVSPAFTDESFEPDETTDASGSVELIRAAPEPDEIDGWLERTDPALVVAATDDTKLNEAIVTAAKERHVLVNRADRSGGREAGSVVVPATVRDGRVVVSVSTGGTAPALSKHLRRELEGTLEGAGEMASLLAALRSELKRREVSPERRRDIVSEVVGDPEVWTVLRTVDSKNEQVIEDVLGEKLETGGESP